MNVKTFKEANVNLVHYRVGMVLAVRITTLPQVCKPLKTKSSIMQLRAGGDICLSRVTEEVGLTDFKLATKRNNAAHGVM